MNINSFDPTAFSINVWNNATRTLTADPSTDAVTGALVWAHTGRSITSLAPVRTISGVAHTTLAAGANVSFQPAAGVYRRIVIASIGGSGTTLQVQMFDPVSSDIVVTGAAAGTCTYIGYCTNSNFVKLVSISGSSNSGYQAQIMDEA